MADYLSRPVYIKERLRKSGGDSVSFLAVATHSIGDATI
jgi:hypothetical protein